MSHGLISLSFSLCFFSFDVYKGTCDYTGEGEADNNPGTQEREGQKGEPGSLKREKKAAHPAGSKQPGARLPQALF